MSPALRIGAKLPSSGPLARQVPLLESARLAEEADFDSVWVSDHVVMMRDHASPYPFSSDGKMSWDPEYPWHDPLIAMAMCAAVTERIEIGVAVLIVPMRNPVILAKQLASLDALSDGRVVVGAGAGWLAEEFDALGASFQTRGERLDAPHVVVIDPRISFGQPVVAGTGIRTSVLAAGVAAIAAESARAGRVIPGRVVIRVAGPTPSVAGQLAGLQEVGVTDVVVDVNWDNGGPRQTVEMLRG